VTAVKPIKAGPYRDNLADLIETMANAGLNDPIIARRLDITLQQVRGIRRVYDIPAGERRWLPEHRRNNPKEGSP
jgi:hypothetical protein